ncbi:hypothetical protein SprV_0100057600 [Sparganum proliferum]
MGKVEKTRLQDAINGLVFYGRYVDDIFCLADGTTDIDDLVQEFNGVQPSLKFTADAEADIKIAFLDVLLHRQEDGCIQRRLFRKKTWTRQYVYFHRYVPLNIKQNLFQGLAARLRRICSPEVIDGELQQLRNTLRENGYPARFILQNIGEGIAKPTVATAEKKDVVIRLPFAEDAERELVRRHLTKVITRAFPEANLRDLAIETIELLLQSKYDEAENRLGHAQVLQLLKLCHRKYFTLDGTIHEQVKGTPMGSQISRFIAEAAPQQLESLAFQHHSSKFWALYVDDTFVVIDRD